MSKQTAALKICSLSALMLTVTLATAGGMGKDSSGHPITYKGMGKEAMMDDKMAKEPMMDDKMMKKDAMMEDKMMKKDTMMDDKMMKKDAMMDDKMDKMKE